MTKIVGFLITKEESQPQVDFFNVGLKKNVVKSKHYYLHYWGIGDIDKCKIGDKFTLSFPLHDSLLDRNILIGFENDTITIENDWLGSIPVYYNKKEKIVSTLPNFCLKDKTIHGEGFANFCEFGYSVFEQTLFRDVKFMRYFSKLTLSDDELSISYKDDPVLSDLLSDEEVDEETVIDLMQTYVSNIEADIDGDIILPTSGGYDSRILNYFVQNKKRIRSFTYGISSEQIRSTEVVHAKKIAEIFHTMWEPVELNNFNAYIGDWAKLYGYATHLHGMYHIEFYTKILKRHHFRTPTFLSGIIGDAWAEAGKFKSIKQPRDLVNLGYTHGMNLELGDVVVPRDHQIKKRFFDENKAYLENDKVKSVFAMRTKLILISYLTQIPEYFGWPVWTPFLNYEIVKATLNIPEKRRINRTWQRDFFKRVGLNLEDMHLKSVKSNMLAYEIAQQSTFEPINVVLMKKYIRERRLIEINNILLSGQAVHSNFDMMKNRLLAIPRVGGVLRLFGWHNRFLKALNEYYVIKSIEKSLASETPCMQETSGKFPLNADPASKPDIRFKEVNI